MKVVSACLAGVKCRYNSESFLVPAIRQLVISGQAIPICPEVLGGMPVPRLPAERCGSTVCCKDGTDVTACFADGAKRALAVAMAAGADCAVLKARSPSCGAGLIYDGTFSHTLISGDGIFAELLRKRGIKIYTEEDLPE